MTDRLYNDDDDARLFRENDDLGSDSSVWLRPLRQLFRDGKPIGRLAALTVSPMGKPGLPLGILSETQKDRLIFWPALPSGVDAVCAGKSVDVFDHITLEFPSERIHVTAYDIAGKAVHDSRAWRTHHFDDRGLALWFLLLLRISVLQQQDMAVQRRIQTPASDKERRINEFVGLKEHLTLHNIPLPPHDAKQDYVYFGLYLRSTSATTDRPSIPILPVNASLNSQVEGWPPGKAFLIAGFCVPFGKRLIYTATACPPGKLLSDVSVGFPQRKSHRKR